MEFTLNKNVPCGFVGVCCCVSTSLGYWSKNIRPGSRKRLKKITAKKMRKMAKRSPSEAPKKNFYIKWAW